MNIIPVRGLLVAGALCALAVNSVAQVIELRATISPQQENPPTSSGASGSAIMLYDVRTNSFDLMVSITGMSNVATASHIHEAAVGVNGGVVTNLGGEAAYTRNGSNLTATFRNIQHSSNPAAPATLLRGGAYYNIHSAQFPGGEIRGQLMPTPIRLYANLDTAQEQLAMPAVNLSAINNFGGAIMLYDPVAGTIRLRHSLFNFNNPFSNSHIHNGAMGISGGTNTNLGTSATAGNYSSVDGYIAGAHDIPLGATADPIQLLMGNMYLNYHSTAFSNGQLRGQIYVSNEIPSTRLINVAMRGMVGAGDQVLIGGFVVAGTEPVRVLISAKGPSLTAFGLTGVLANPRLTLHDSAGRQIALNDDVGAIAAGSELAAIPGVPRNAVESALVVVLPPGNYTAIVSATAGTGIALLEVNDLRTLSPTVTTASLDRPTPIRANSLAAASKAALEICAAVPLAVTGANR